VLFILLSPRLSPVLGAHTGLTERVLLLAVFAWYMVVGWRLFVLARLPQAAEVPDAQGQKTLAKTAKP
jgi:hypothetical protein